MFSFFPYSFTTFFILSYLPFFTNSLLSCFLPCFLPYNLNSFISSFLSSFTLSFLPSGHLYSCRAILYFFLNSAHPSILMIVSHSFHLLLTSFMYHPVAPSLLLRIHSFVSSFFLTILLSFVISSSLHLRIKSFIAFFLSLPPPILPSFTLCNGHRSWVPLLTGDKESCSHYVQ